MDSNFEKENELSASEMQQLRDAYNDVYAAPDLENKIVHSLKKEGLIVVAKQWHQRKWMKGIAAVFVLFSLFAMGWLSATRLGSVDPGGVEQAGVEAGSAGGKQLSYLLLLYDAPGFVPDEGHVAEYGSWMQSLYEQGMVIDGKELNDKGWTLTNNDNSISLTGKPVSGNYGAVSGFFIINTSSEAEAMKVASSCPHVKHNGVIEVRPIIL